MREARIALLPLVALLATPSPVRAQHPEIDSPEVRAGVAALEALDYPRAVQHFEHARAEQLTLDELTVTLRGLGMAHAALGQDAAAVGAFEALLRVIPDTRLERTVSPRIRALFEQARARATATATPPPDPPQGAPAAPPRLEPTPAAATPSAPPEPRHAPAARPPAPVVPPQAVTPPTSTAPVEESRPVWRKGWFWGVLGGVAAAGLAAGIVGGLLTRDGTLVVLTR